MRQTAIKEFVLQQFRGRRTAWILAPVISSVLVAAIFYALRPECDLMFYPAVVARNYAMAWVCLFVFIGVTNKAKLALAVLAIFWPLTRPMMTPRIPRNEYSTVLWLNDMQAKLRSTNMAAKELSDIIGPALGKTGQLSGYQFEYLPEQQGIGLEHYVITARPQCYCKTGQKSFILDDSGAIHYTAEDRAATREDPVVRQD